jgi:hypothetical protein
MDDNKLRVQWVKSAANSEYLDLLRLDLNGTYFAVPRYGVYIIWYVAPGGAKVIRVGQGNIAERLSLHRSDPQITRYGSFGQLKVSWIFVGSDPVILSGVEAFLYDYYKPLVGERAPGVIPIEVTPLI